MLVELAVGDAYGAGFEYADAAFVRRYNDLSDYVKHPRHTLRPGCYTDDTQMSLAIAELLVEKQPWTAENLAAKFVEVFRRDPRTGYAGGFYRFLKQVTSGAEFLERIRPDSDKSGAAMRAAPLGDPLIPLLKQRLGQVESQLGTQPLVHLHTFERDGRRLHLAVTERLRKTYRKEGVWKSKEMLVTLKNARYGCDERQARSPGGRDGLFRMDRDYRPPNAMMKKLFDQFLDHPHSEAEAIAAALGTSPDTLEPVRLVSHHLRLLGVLLRNPTDDQLVLVDVDRTK